MGISPFGEKSPASDVVSGKGYMPVEAVPYIASAINVDNKSIQLTWQFSSSKNAAIKGFSIERSDKPKGIFVPVNATLLQPTSRDYLDPAPAQINYYRVTANALNGDKFVSSLYYAQLVDSIPPGIPAGLKATIDEFGTVNLSWTPNSDKDIYGYRIYKANNKSEELAQLTSEPLAAANYMDKANLKTLNEYVYYAVIAVDRNQNQSKLSALLQVNLPDKIKPQPPVFLPVKSSDAGVLLSWIASASDDVQHYDVYRQPTHSREWQRIKIIPVTVDSIYQYTDETSEAGKLNRYTLIAIDEAGLESAPAQVVTGVKLDNVLKPAVEWKPQVITSDKNQVTLNWSYELGGVKSFCIYKSIEGTTLALYKTIPATARNFSDTITPGKNYTYQIMAVFENDKQSKFSKALIFTY
jgi:fibronectin type 3 domain-containing protein